MLKFVLSAAVVAGISQFTWAAEETQPPAPGPFRVQIGAGTPIEFELQLGGTDGAPGRTAAKLGEFWIGLICKPIENAKGLVVENVIPDGPAAKADLRKGDVLLKAADQELELPMDLVAAVNKAKQNKLAIELRRGGETLSIEVVPAKRPVNDATAAAEEVEKAWKTLEQFGLRRWLVQPNPDGIVRWQMIGPGGMIVRDNLQKRELPDDVTITVTKSGKKPAEISVNKGSHSEWKGTEEQLDKLPQELRPHVEMMLGRHAMPLGAPPQFNVLQPNVPAPRIERRMIQPDNSLEKKVDELGRQIEEMKKALDQMRPGQPPKTPEPATKPVESSRQPKFDPREIVC